MKRLIKRLICLFRGHKWRRGMDFWNPIAQRAGQFKVCARCGKTKEEI